MESIHSRLLGFKPQDMCHEDGRNNKHGREMKPRTYKTQLVAQEG
jgi:hypothetical protein